MNRWKKRALIFGEGQNEIDKETEENQITE